MHIKVKDGNVMRLQAALNGANGKAQKHTALPADVLALADRAERSLMAAGLAGRARAGTEVAWHGAGPAAKAYGYKITRTYVALTRGTRDWFMTDMKRVGVYPSRASATASPFLSASESLRRRCAPSRSAMRSRASTPRRRRRSRHAS